VSTQRACKYCGFSASRQSDEDCPDKPRTDDDRKDSVRAAVTDICRIYQERIAELTARLETAERERDAYLSMLERRNTV
jgi:hypothetical protein